MKTIRHRVFETNSSTSHSLVLFNQIKACGLEIDTSKEITITLIPLCDEPNEWQEKIINSLNHASYMVDYLYTILMCARYYNECNNGYKNERIFDLATQSSVLIDKIQAYLVELGYTIQYKQPLVLTKELDDYEKIYIEMNDGSDITFAYEIEELLETKESFQDYIENHTWVIAYRG